MTLLVVEILLATLALKRGWRAAPLLLVALPIVEQACEATLASVLGPWLGTYFDPGATPRALAHTIALVGLVATAWTGPAEVAGVRRLARRNRRRSGPLYQI
jgi:hypothetical protein